MVLKNALLQRNFVIQKTPKLVVVLWVSLKNNSGAKTIDSTDKRDFVSWMTFGDLQSFHVQPVATWQQVLAWDLVFV